jgi:hypothetical protein
MSNFKFEISNLKFDIVNNFLCALFVLSVPAVVILNIPYIQLKPALVRPARGKRASDRRRPLDRARFLERP